MILPVLLLAANSIDNAQALLRAHRLPEAKQAVASVLDQQPESLPALLLQGRIAMASDEPRLAERSFRRAVEVSKGEFQPRFFLGFFYYVENDFTRALPVLQEARKLKPDDHQNLLFLALTLDGLARPAEAELLFQQLLRKPSVEAHIAYGRMLFANGRFPEAQRQVTSALALDALAPETHYEQARLHLQAGRYGKCISEASLALGRPSEGVTERQIHFLLSRAYTATGNTEKAGYHRQRFEALAPRMIR